MKQKHIDAAREARLWISQIVIPVFGIMMMVPEAREAAKEKASELKRKIETKFKK